MANDHPPDARGERLSRGDIVVVVNDAAFDRGQVVQITRIYGTACSYRDRHGQAWARRARSLVKIPNDVAHDPELVNAFLVMSGLREPSDASDT